MNTEFESDLKRNVEEIKKSISMGRTYMEALEDELKSLLKFLKISCSVSMLWIFILVIYLLYKH